MATGVAVAKVDVKRDDRIVESNLEAVDTAMAFYTHVGDVFPHEAWVEGTVEMRFEET